MCLHLDKRLCLRFIIFGRTYEDVDRCGVSLRDHASRPSVRGRGTRYHLASGCTRRVRETTEGTPKSREGRRGSVRQKLVTGPDPSRKTDLYVGPVNWELVTGGESSVHGGESSVCSLGPTLPPPSGIAGLRLFQREPSKFYKRNDFTKSTLCQKFRHCKPFHETTETSTYLSFGPD